MRLVYLPVNMAWAFLFGPRLATASVVAMGDSGRFFARRADAVAAAERCRLKVNDDGSVEAM